MAKFGLNKLFLRLLAPCFSEPGIFPSFHFNRVGRVKAMVPDGAVVALALPMELRRR